MQNTKRKQISELEYSDHIFAKDPHLEYKPIDESKALTLTFDEARAFLDNELGICGDIIGISE